eukprot:1387530-Amorphochlora_amoeboformis.AAC.1
MMHVIRIILYVPCSITYITEEPVRTHGRCPVRTHENGGTYARMGQRTHGRSRTYHECGTCVPSYVQCIKPVVGRQSKCTHVTSGSFRATLLLASSTR